MGGRPDMAFIPFHSRDLARRTDRRLYHGKMQRDFTYIDDIVEGIIRTSQNPAAPSAQWDGMHPDPATSTAPYRIYNIGNNQPVELGHFLY